MRNWTVKTAIALFAATLAVSCTKDVDEHEQAYGKRMIFTAAAANVTGSSVSGGWDGISSVAVKVEGEVREYKVSTSGNSVTLSSDTPFLWKSLEESVEAWWPVDASDISRKPPVLVKADQSTEEALNASDFIEASGTAKFADPRLEFRHRTAKVTVELIPGDGVTNVGGATLAVASAADGVEGGATSCNAFRTSSGTSSTGTYTVLLPPQTIPGGTAFVTVRMIAGSEDFKHVFRPSSDVILEESKEYTFRLRVNMTALELAEAPNIGEWGAGSSTPAGAFQYLNLSTVTGGGRIEVRDRENLFIGGKTSEQLYIVDSRVTLMDAEITGGIVTEGSCGITLQGSNKVSTPGVNEDDPWGVRGHYPGILPKSGRLYIDGDGRLEVKGGCGGAGIGGGRGSEFAAGASIDIYGGEIHATGGFGGGAGIGGGREGAGCGMISIYGGKIYAQSYPKDDPGSEGLGGGAGIGGGLEDAECREIVFKGGEITAISHHKGAGIGGGSISSDCWSISIESVGYSDEMKIDARASVGAGIGSGFDGSRCHRIEISWGKGEITAASLDSGAGIGSGSGANTECAEIRIGGDGRTVTARASRGAGIGAGYGSSCGSIQISQGVIHAYGGTVGGAAIGAGLADGTAKSDCDDYINIYKSITEVNVYLYNVTEEGTPFLGIGAWGESSCAEVNIDTDLADSIFQNTPELYHRVIYHRLNLDLVGEDRTIDFDCTLFGTTHQRITIAEGVTVTLKGALFAKSLVCENNVTLKLFGSNAAQNMMDTTYAAVFPKGNLRIEGGGELDAYSLGGCAGIGCGTAPETRRCEGRLSIYGGKITAQGWAGIGISRNRWGGEYPYFESVHIYGGNITARGQYGIGGVIAGDIDPDGEPKIVISLGPDDSVTAAARGNHNRCIGFSDQAGNYQAPSFLKDIDAEESMSEGYYNYTKELTLKQ